MERSEIRDDESRIPLRFMRATGGPLTRLTDDQLAQVEAARREAREGKFASDEQMAALWRKFEHPC
jgi:hypothetical protein